MRGVWSLHGMCLCKTWRVCVGRLFRAGEKEDVLCSAIWRGSVFFDRFFLFSAVLWFCLGRDSRSS